MQVLRKSSQLFSFPASTAADCCAVLVHNNNVCVPSASISQEYLITDVTISGSPGQPFEVEEDFRESMFLMLLKSSQNLQIDGMINYSLQSDKGNIFLCAGYNLYPADEWLENHDSEEGLYLFSPSFEQRSQLEEKAADKERVHLSEDIKGIHL